MCPKVAPRSTHDSGPMALFAVASLLLTFFVALTAMSERETARTRAVADSFARRGAAPAVPVSVVPLGGDMPSVRSVERRWSEVFPILSAAPATSFGEGRVLRGAIAADEAFAAGTAELTAKGIARLDAMARLVADPPSGLALRLEAMLALAPDADARAARLAAMRARAILRHLGVHAPSAATDGDLAVGVAREQPTGATANGAMADTIDFELRLSWRAHGPPGLRKPGG